MIRSKKEHPEECCSYSPSPAKKRVKIIASGVHLTYCVYMSSTEIVLINKIAFGIAKGLDGLRTNCFACMER